MTDRTEPVDSPDASTLFPYHELREPSLAEIRHAAAVVDEHLFETPLVRSEWLSAELDAEVYLKREDVFPIGAFKVRGGLALVDQLDDAFRDTGLVAASTGNHGQSIAYAGRAYDVPVLICVPEGANPGKVAAMERLGATVEHHGDDFDEAREHAEELAAEAGYRYVHSANEPALIAGVATAGLEVVADLPDVDVAISPVGGGTSASGYCLTVGQLTDAEVIGVQSAQAPGMHEAWQTGSLEPYPSMETFAEGLATRVPFALTTEILRERLDDFRLVDDDDILSAIRQLLAEDHILIEGASASAIAGALELGDELAGKQVVMPTSGRNLSIEKLRRLLE